MNYKVIPTKEFAKDFRKLDSNFRLRVKKKIEEVAQNPERYKQLHFDFKGSCRIRIGKIRVVFSYDVKKHLIY